MSEVTSTSDGTLVIVLSPDEADSLAALLHTHVINNHPGQPRPYPYLRALGLAVC